VVDRLNLLKAANYNLLLKAMYFQSQ